MTGIDHRLIDLIQQLRRKQAKVVLERLHLVLALVGPVAVTQKLAQRTVLIRQFVDPIEVGIQAQAQHAECRAKALLLSVSTRIDGALITLFDGHSRGDSVAEREQGIRRDLRWDLIGAGEVLCGCGGWCSSGGAGRNRRSRNR